MRGFNVLGVPNILPEIQTSNPITQNKQNLFFERKQVRKQDNPRKSLTPVILHPLIVRDPCACGRSRRVRKPARALFFDSFRTGSGQMGSSLIWGSYYNFTNYNLKHKLDVKQTYLARGVFSSNVTNIWSDGLFESIVAEIVAKSPYKSQKCRDSP